MCDGGLSPHPAVDDTPLLVIGGRCVTIRSAKPALKKCTEAVQAPFTGRTSNAPKHTRESRLSRCKRCLAPRTALPLRTASFFQGLRGFPDGCQQHSGG